MGAVSACGGGPDTAPGLIRGVDPPPPPPPPARPPGGMAPDHGQRASFWDYWLRGAGGTATARRKGPQVEIPGKKAVIVGGASGMARATAELLHNRGADIAILDLPTSAGAEV